MRPQRSAKMSQTEQAMLALAIVNHMTTPSAVFDRGARLVALNPAAEELLRLSLNQALGLELQAILQAPARCVSALARVLSSAEPVAERDVVLHATANDTVSADCMMTPLDPQARHVLVEFVVLDRYKQIVREQRLVEESEASRVVLRGLAHEIRNPLGGLRGAAQLLERELADPALREYTQIIVHEADRLQSLLDRMIGPRTPPNLRRINVHEVTERVLALLRAEAPVGVVVDKDYDPSIPGLEADSELLIQAVLNVARNAVQAVGESGRVLLTTRVERNVSIGPRHHRLAARIDVLDDGPGIAEEILDHIFYPLVTGRCDGTGLGLSIAQSLVNQHGGLVECRTQPGCTQFSIVLPIHDGANEAVQPW